VITVLVSVCCSTTEASATGGAVYLDLRKRIATSEISDEVSWSRG
jgi:hypothetical protein